MNIFRLDRFVPIEELQRKPVSGSAKARVVYSVGTPKFLMLGHQLGRLSYIHDERRVFAQGEAPFALNK